MSFIESVRGILSRNGKSGKGGAASASGKADKRAVKRVPQRMRSGFVWNDKLISVRPCMFKDVSVKGARVEIMGDPIKPGLLAEGVLLYFDTEKHEIPCSVAWVKGMQLGLKFEGRPRAPSRKYR
jgi:hypothetical protein